MQNGSSNPGLFGARVKRVEDPRYIKGLAHYIDDLNFPGQVFASFVRSMYPHATITRISTDPVYEAEGVKLAWSSQDIVEKSGPIQSSIKGGFKPTDYPLLAQGKVRFVGEPVGVVVTETRYQATDAAGLFEVDYAPLDPVTDAVEAVTPGSNQAILHDGLDNNILFQAAMETPGIDQAFQEAHYVLKDRFKTGRVTGVPIENRGCIAIFDPGTEDLTLYTSTQIPHLVRTGLADILHYPENKIRVIAPDVGGGFGLKAHLFPEEAVVCLLAMQLKRPVKWIETRSENLSASTHSRGQTIDIEMAFNADGTIRGLRTQIVVDVGAYSVYPWSAALEPAQTARLLTGPYKIEQYAYKTYGVATNKCPTGPYRGVSRPSANLAIERALNMAALHLGLDQAEIRRRNLVKKEEFPYKNVVGLKFDPGSYIESLDQALEMVDYASFPQRQAEARAKGRYIGLGISCYNEMTAQGSESYRSRGMEAMSGYEPSTVRVDPSGKVIVMVGVSPHGQGHETTFAQVVASELQLPLSDVKVVHSDTGISPYGMGTFSSRSAVIAGGACIEAAGKIREKAKKIAGHLLEATAEDIVLENDRYHVKGVSSPSLTLRDISRTAHLAAYKLPPEMEPGLEATGYFASPPATFSNATHIVQVEVDASSGDVQILDYVVVEDCGKMINPMVVDGQIQGGVAQGIGEALMEALEYDQHGQLLTGTLMDYALPTSHDIPNIRIAHIETPSPWTKGGMKGMGEGGTISPGAAIANAVTDALTPFGLEFNEIPITPHLVFNRLQSGLNKKEN
ncbi:MAG: xanthine dehydrogenase, molybdenum binding subunit apoprotein [Chloroflexi bacterium]|nr:xanthine dehydrogenase, molybdenum binding subunit apoprotein [Chloroflexota bacterium]